MPGCNNTVVKTPNKIFSPVPGPEKKKWAQATRCQDADTVKSSNVWFCCEDHFEVSHKQLHVKLSL